MMHNFGGYLLSNAYSSIFPIFNIGSSLSAVGMVERSPFPLFFFLTFGFIWLLAILVGILSIVSMWKIFDKAGKPGWASIIPIYNVVVMLEIVNRPIWWVILMFIPFVSIVIAFIITYELVRAFGKDIGFAIGVILLPFIFLPILAFGDAKYMGPQSQTI